ncbi:hypothetical protein COE99_09520 [Bacillus toyonensis]|uniref:nSTAND3 domain-containing NTPase n=1 Tax=Bacillus toyonensis TaxID=155322 RepID=UPI000BFD183B|nr:restriction endonuclease [Bacillus toyonensis]PHC09935.1 hypothetical protein COE99_09520 [Bacillus toyonensis]
MLNYDFTILSPPEFEEFSRDVLQEHLSITFESFKDGKDGGIDFRHSIDKKNTILVQCKRYTEYKNLYQELKKELKKVKKLIPERYILVTSVDLSVGNKKEILDLFGVYIKNTSDIIGKGDLNNYLGQYNHLERKYYKLWMSSTTIMDKIINGEVHNRSEFTEKEIKNDVSLYVQNESYGEAIDILEKNNYIVISGIPGIGKTTLAKMLIYKYLTEGYGLVKVSRDIDQAEKVFVEGKKQVFFYDDFLGRVSLDRRLEKNEESSIVQFLRKVRRDDNKKLIMTTREYIFQQAKIEYQEFERLPSSIIDLKKYSEMIKAKILYNHLFYSNVPRNYLKHLLEKDNYLQIVNHKNYSPRLIEFLTFDYDMYTNTEEEYFIDFMRMLNNPKELWKIPFENHISQVSRYVLYTLLLFGKNVDIDKLKEGLESLIKVESEKYSINYNRNDFNNSVKELDKTFIKIEENMIDFQNPSIQDFLIHYISKDKDLIISLIKSAVYFQQLFNVFKNINKDKFLSSGNIYLDEDIVKEVESVVIKKFDELEFLSEGLYRRSEPLLSKLTIISKFFEMKEGSRMRRFLISKIKNLDLNYTKTLNYLDFSRYMSLLYIVMDEVLIDNKKVLISQFIGCLNSLNSLEDIYDIEEMFPDEYKELRNEIESKVVEVIEEEIFSVDEDDLDELNDLKEKVENIESELGIELFFQISDIEDKIHHLEEELEELEELEEEIIIKKNINKKSTDSKIEVKALFNSLKK